MEKQEYYTLEQIADKLQITVETVRTYLKRKKNRLISYRIGREYRVRREDFERWLAEQQYRDEDEKEG